MPNIGPLEIGIVLLIALIVFGPKRLPGLGRSMGEGLRQFKSSVNDFHDKDTTPAPAPAPEEPPRG